MDFSDLLSGLIAAVFFALLVWRGVSNVRAGVANTKKRMGKQD